MEQENVAQEPTAPETPDAPAPAVDDTDDLAQEAANELDAGLAADTPEEGSEDAAPEVEAFDGYELDGKKIAREEIQKLLEIQAFYGSDPKFDNWRANHLRKASELDREKKAFENPDHPIRQSARQFETLNEAYRRDPVAYASNTLKLAVQQGLLPPQALQIADNLTAAFTESGLYNPAEVQARYLQQQQAQIQAQHEQAQLEAQGHRLIQNFERTHLKRFMTDEERNLLAMATQRAATFNPNATIQDLWNDVVQEVQRRALPKPVTQPSVQKQASVKKPKPVLRGGATGAKVPDDLDALLGEVQSAFQHR